MFIRSYKTLFTIAFLTYTSLGITSIYDYFPKDVGPTSSRYGGIGLIEYPSARFQSPGNLRLGITSRYPYEVTALTTTPFSWMEATYRYTEIKNQLYSPYASFSGNQTLKDKGFDFRFLLLKESNFIPNLAIGARDVAGTGLFASEYLVASKRFWNLDVTLGLGWGLLAGEGKYSNPLGKLRESFKTRSTVYGGGATAGDFSFRNFFAGEKVGLFGGLEYSLPYKGLRLKLEYDTSNQDINSLTKKSPYNFSLVGGQKDMIEYSVGLTAGSEFNFSFFVKGDFGTGPIVPKMNPPIKLKAPSAKDRNRLNANRELLFGSLNANLAVEKIYTQGISMSKDEITLTINQAKFRSQPRAIGRAIRVASFIAPENIKYITINTMNADIEMSSTTVLRNDIENYLNNKGSISEIWNHSKLRSPETQHYKNADFQPVVNFPEIRTNIAPALRNMIGGPEAFFLGQLWIRINNTIKLARGLEINTVAGINVYSNFNQLRTASDSTLPHVRSDIQDYFKEGQNNIQRMKIDYMWSPYRDVIARLDFGLLEEMFGGAGGEILYRPYNKTWAIGLVAHKVKQRAYNQRFNFKDYEVTTGHLEIYKEFPKLRIIAQIMAGKFLAGDVGATLDVSRRYHTGLRLGFFATRTNTSSEEFGEGSFDKGIYFQIPHDLFFTNYSTGNVFFGLHPLTRDGGALLVQHHSLYSVTGNTAFYELERDWEDLLQ